MGTVGAWAFALISVFAFPADIPELTGLAMLLFPVAGLFLFVALFVALLTSERRALPAASLVFVVLVCAGFLADGLYWGSRLHLLVSKTRYEKAIERLLAAQDTAEDEKLGDSEFVMSKKPLRVAFHFCHWPFNWLDIVYDPTGAVAGKRISDLKVINAYLVRADHLDGDWYLGRFGD